MAEVTGLTAAKMQEIADASIVTGVVDGDGHLQLTTSGGDTVDAGNVAGPQGATGPQGPAGVAGDAPAGSIMMFGATIPPTGWLVCDGSAVSRTTYADLFAAISTAFGAGDGTTTFNLPDMRGRMPRHENTNFAVAGGTTPSSHHHAVDGGTPAVAAHVAMVTGGSAASEERIASDSWTSNFEVHNSTNDTSSDTHSVGAKVVGNTADTTDTLPPYLNVSFIIKT